MSNTQPINFYIHIPYCKYRCRYCNFFLVAGRTPHLPAYFRALEKEILMYKNKVGDRRDAKSCVSTIYFGGGTPSLVDSQIIGNIINLIKNVYGLTSDYEIAIETNPENLTSKKLQDYLSFGINRISIGLQAWQNDILKYIGRLYTIEEFIQKYQLVKDSGFKNINVDLIFGIPNLTLKQWEESLDNVIALNPNHISAYSLEVDEGSIFGKLEKLGKFKRMPDELDRKMYRLAEKKLKAAGYKHYEISNWAKEGYECKHNLNTWNFNDYIGIGASSHSFFDGFRFNNFYSIEKYLASILKNKFAYENKYKLTKSKLLAENIIVGLRKIEGINIAELNSKFKIDFVKKYTKQLEKLSAQKLIKVQNNTITLTSKGRDLENVVAVEFI